MSDIVRTIEELKKQRDAVILAHYYVDGAVQDIADYVGDSYYLSKIATEVPQQTIIFCGVQFMAESAKILNPEKTVIMPELKADCPMAHMVDAETIRQAREQYEDLAVVCYINSTAEIKALCDVCVTSANAEKIIKSLEEKNILFVPDENLARYVARNIPQKNFVFNEGFCCVHTSNSTENVSKAQEMYPDALLVVHPECTLDVIDMADYVGSTSGIIDFVNSSNADSFIIGTEIGVLHQLKKANPCKQFYFVATKKMCSDMKMITLEKIVAVLENMNNQIELDEQLIQSAKLPLQRMHQLGE